MADPKDLNQRAVDGSLPVDPEVESARVQRPVLHLATSKRDDAAESSAAEKSICAALLWSSTYAPDECRVDLVCDLVSPDRFSNRRLADVLTAIASLRAEGAVAEPVSVKSAMMRLGLAASVTVEQLEGLVSGATAPTETLLRQWATLVREAWVRRQVATSAESIARAARSGDAKAAIAAAESTLLLASDAASSVGLVDASVALDSALRKVLDPRADRGVSTGIVAIDRAVGNWMPGHLTILGAYTGDGKTAYGLTMAGNVARRGGGALYASTEMAAGELMMRLAGSWAAVPARAMLAGTMTPNQSTQICGEIARFKGLPLKVVNESSMTTSQLDSHVRKAKYAFEAGGIRLRLVVVDYVQEMGADVSKGTRRDEALLKIATQLHTIAVRYQVSVLGLVQTHPVNAKADGGDGRPNLQHIAEAKALARPAETVMFIHRSKVDGKYQPRGAADIVVRKSRWGARGDVPVLFDGPCMRFEDDPERPFQEG
jgi:replicative DNA helicase